MRVAKRQEADLTLVGRFRLASVVQAWLILLIALAVLVGWQFNLEFLKRVAPGLVAMNPLTALNFMALGLALLLLRGGPNPQSLRWWIGQLLATVVVALGALIIVRYIWGLPLYPDRCLFTDKLALAEKLPNVMAPNSAFGFLLGGLSLLASRVRNTVSLYVAECLAVIVSFGAVFVLYGYLYQSHALIAVEAFIPVAANTSVCFLLLGLAILFSRPDDGLMALLSNNQGASYLLRRLVPATILAPGVLGWALIAGQRAGYYSDKIAVVLFVAAIAPLGTLLVYILGLALQNKELEAQQIKDDFLSLATHQLQTPSTGVKMALSLLKDGKGGKLTKEQAELVQDAFEANESEIKIVQDLLNVARADSGRMVLKKSPTDVYQLIHDVADRQRAVITARRQHLTLSVHHLVVDADADRLRMVVENLLSNASKYTPDGGKLVIQATRLQERIVIAVIDSGVGIAEHDIPKLFTKFSRLDNPLSSVRGGTGLGLYLVKQIVELHGGSIKVISELNKGSEFIVELPAR